MGQRRECMKRRRGIKGRVDRNGNLMVVLCLKPNQPTFQGIQMENGNFIQKDSKPKKKVIDTRNLKRLDQVYHSKSGINFFNRDNFVFPSTSLSSHRYLYIGLLFCSHFIS
jgi:hypothetical protein